jgi:hypothetical protein
LRSCGRAADAPAIAVVRRVAGRPRPARWVATRPDHGAAPPRARAWAAASAPSCRPRGARVRNLTLGPRCAIATSTATTGVPVDIRPSTIANVSGTAVLKSRPAHLRNFPPKKLEASPPADVPPSRRARRDRRGEFAIRLSAGFRAVRASAPINPASSPVTPGTCDPAPPLTSSATRRFEDLFLTPLRHGRVISSLGAQVGQQAV